MANWRGSVSYPRGRCELGVKVSKLWGSQNPTQSDGATAGERELRTTQLCLIYCFIWLLDAAGGTLGEVWRYCNSAASCLCWRWSLELYNLLPHNNQPTDAIIYDTTSSSPAYSSSLLSSSSLSEPSPSESEPPNIN